MLFFSEYLELKLYGIAIGMSIQFTLRFFIMLTLIRFSRIWESVVSPFDPENFKNLWPQVVISSGAGAMMLIGMYAY